MVAGLVTPESIVNPDSMFAKNRIDLIIDEAKHIDAEGKKVYLSDGRDIPYDKLILGAGASPFVPPIEGHELEGVFALRSLSDAERIKDHLEKAAPRKLVFIAVLYRCPLAGQTAPVSSNSIGPVSSVPSPH